MYIMPRISGRKTHVGLDELPTLFLFLTGVPLLAYAGSHALWGTTYQLGENVVAVVTVLSFLLVLFSILPSPRSGEFEPPGASYVLVVGAPLGVYVAHPILVRASKTWRRRRCGEAP
jgi:hypothetical protein